MRTNIFLVEHREASWVHALEFGDIVDLGVNDDPLGASRVSHRGMSDVGATYEIILLIVL